MQYKCIAKNALGNSDGAITLYQVHPPTTTTTESTTQIITEKPKRKNRKRNRKRQRQRHREQHLDEQQDEIEEISEEGQVIEEVNHISFIINEDKGTYDVNSNGANPIIRHISTFFFILLLIVTIVI